MLKRHFAQTVMCSFCFVLAAGSSAVGACAVRPPVVGVDDHRIADVVELLEAVAEHHIASPSRRALLELTVSVLAEDADAQRIEAVLSADAVPSEEQKQRLVNALQDLVGGDSVSDQQFDSILAELTHRVPGGMRLVAPEEQRVTEQVAANRYVGIGIQLSIDEARDRPVMPRVFENGPAFQAGARDGDVILTVDSQDTSGVPLVEVVQWLRGPAGSEVTVELQGPDADSPRKYRMTRGVVPIASIEKTVVDANETVIGITVSRVAASTVQELRKVDAGLAATIDTVVLDLRATTADNMHYVELLGNSLIDNDTIGRIRTTSGVRESRAEPGRLFRGRQLVVLVHPQSESPAWWLAAAVVDTNTGLVMTPPRLPQTKFAAPLYFKDSRPVRSISGVVAEQPTFIHLAVAELLRGDGSGFASLANDVITLSARGQSPPQRASQKTNAETQVTLSMILSAVRNASPSADGSGDRVR